MTTLAQFTSASPGTVAAVAVPAALLIAVLLIIPVVSGVRRRRRPPPRPAQGLPTHASPDVDGRDREPADVPRDGHRRGPHELPGHGNLASRPPDPEAHDHDGRS
ncbi:DUF6479 family protein [Embleya sp. NPDC020630]|uniref:DUF6479 family protein n=1 Tax=Embleya sp. NPDC020630 TaxID=3363979 RepID=UPI003796BB82